VDALPDANVEQLLQDLHSSDYATRRGAIEQLGKLPSSNYEILSALITTMNSGGSFQIVKALGVCLASSAHSKLLGEFSFASKDADSGEYNPPTSASERIIYDYVHKKQSDSRINHDKALAGGTPSLISNAPAPNPSAEELGSMLPAELDAHNKTYNPPESDQAREEYNLLYYSTRNKIASQEAVRRAQQQSILDQEVVRQRRQQNVLDQEAASQRQQQSAHRPVPLQPGMLTCRECGFANIPDRRICKNCGASLYATLEHSPRSPVSSTLSSSSSAVSASVTPLPIEERRTILDREVARYVSAGYILISRTDNTAQLVSETSPNGCLLIGLFLLGIVPGLIYMMISKRTESLYIEVDDFGHLNHTSMRK